MAIPILNHLDLQKVAELKNARIHNVSSGTFTGGNALGTDNAGLIIYDSGTLKYWNGTSFQSVGTSSGTMSSFTVSATTDTNAITVGDGEDLLFTAGTGITTETTGAQEVTITLNEATSSVRGGIELFSDVDQSVAANTVTSTAGRTYGIQLNSSGQAVVNVPWTDNDTIYTLPLATSTVTGGVQLFSDVDQTVAANTVTTTAGRTYGVQLNSDDQMVVNVPWADNNTTYSDGTGLTLNGTTFNANVDGTQTVAANTSSTTAGRTYNVQVDSSDNLVVNVPWTDTSQLTTEEVQDIVGAFLTTGGTKTLITLTYDDVNNDMDFVVNDDLSLYDNSTSAFITAASLPTVNNATLTVEGTGVLGGTGTFTANQGTNETISITHDAVTRTDGTDTSVSPAAGATFTVVNSISTSNEGHVTGVNTKTVTMPSLASTVTVTDSTANTAFPVVFHNESNGLLDDTGALTYNPSTGLLNVANITVTDMTVTGTQTVNNVEVIETSSGIIFEGATANAFETTLDVVDPTADRAINLPDASGTVALTSDVTDRMVSATITAASVDGTNLYAEITHNLGTADVMVQLYDESTEATVYADVFRTDKTNAASTNKILIVFAAVPTNNIRVVITDVSSSNTGTVAYT